MVSRNLVASFPLHLSESPIEDCEIRLLAEDGDDVSVAANCTPRYDKHGRVVGMVLIGRPVGELRRAPHGY